MRIDGGRAGNAPQHKALFAGRIARVERHAPSQVFDSIAVQIHLELVHSLRMVARRGNVAGDGVADIDDKDCAGFAAEHVKVRDVEANVLPRDRRIEMVGHCIVLLVGVCGRVTCSTANEGKQRLVDDVLVGRAQAVRRAGNHLELRIFHQLCGQLAGIGEGHDLVGVALQD